MDPGAPEDLVLDSCVPLLTLLCAQSSMAFIPSVHCWLRDSHHLFQTPLPWTPDTSTQGTCSSEIPKRLLKLDVRKRDSLLFPLVFSFSAKGSTTYLVFRPNTLKLSFSSFVLISHIWTISCSYQLYIPYTSPNLVTSYYSCCQNPSA